MGSEVGDRAVSEVVWVEFYNISTDEIWVLPCQDTPDLRKWCIRQSPEHLPRIVTPERAKERTKQISKGMGFWEELNKKVELLRSRGLTVPYSQVNEHDGRK